MRGINVVARIYSDRHRNGVCGRPFAFAVYDAIVDGIARRMVTVRFVEDDGETLSDTDTCTFDVNELAEGVSIEAWRGDWFAEATADTFKGA